MATTTSALSTGFPTIQDVQKATGPDGKILPRVMALQQRNTLLQTMTWKEGNTDIGHTISRQTALPSVSWVRLNDGLPSGKGLSDTFTEVCGILGGISSIDCRVAELNGNAAAYRSQLDDDYLASMANTLEAAFFYESTRPTPERILGLSPRLALTTGAFGNQIIKGGGSGNDNTSIWLIGWGPRTVYGISPRGQGAGLKMEDHGKVRTDNSTQTTATQSPQNNILYKYETEFTWKVGLCVEDYRYVVRICNIDSSDLVRDSATGADLIDLMIQATHNIFDLNAANLQWYGNRRISSFLHRQALSKTANSAVTIDPAPMMGSPGVAGKRITSVLGIPFNISDALTIAEATVS